MVGMAMVLVVLGHMSVPFAPDWYNAGLHSWIYRFHMELFVFLSAFLIRYSYKGGNYFRYIGRKARKFLPPFLLVGLAVAAAKMWSAGIAKGDAWGYIGWQLKMLCLYPMRSEASFLWYIYLLMGYYIVSPLVIRFPSWLKRLLCIGAMGLPLLGASHLLGGYLFCKYTFFYFLGLLCAEGWEELRGMKTWLIGLLGVPFVVWSVMFLTGRETFVEVGPAGYNILSGCLSLPFFYFLARLISGAGWLTQWLSRVSKDCFWIYLMQMFVIWGIAFGVRYAGWEGMPFLVFIAVSLPIAILLPIGCARLSEKVGAIKLKK